MTDDGHRTPATLVVGRCTNCGGMTVPVPTFCPLCWADEVSPTEVDGSGDVYSATVVRSGRRDVALPYGLAYVDLDVGPRVMASFAVDDSAPPPGSRVAVSQTGCSDTGLPLLSIAARSVPEVAS